MFKHILKCLLLLICMTTMAQNPEAEINAILQKLDQGESAENMLINLGDINFKTGDYTLEPIAQSYLDKVVQLLQIAPNIDLQIKGHADASGSASINNELAINRASSVQQYLYSQGIANERMKSIGYGSAYPVADNDTKEGRAKNRRVELEVIKKEAVETIQDIIVLRDGSRIGAIIISYDDKQVEYKQFSSPKVYIIEASKVKELIFASGKKVEYEFAVMPDPIPEPEKPKRKKQSGKIKFLQASNYIDNDFRNWHFGVGLPSNLGPTFKDASPQIITPPLVLAYERGISDKVGWGIEAGTYLRRHKQLKEFYQYYTLGLRLMYHFNIEHINENLDPYFGASLNYRAVRVSSPNHESCTGSGFFNKSAFTYYQDDFDANIFAGVRYYTRENFGFFFEMGVNGPANYKLGIIKLLDKSAKRQRKAEKAAAKELKVQEKEAAKMQKQQDKQNKQNSKNSDNENE